MHRRSYTSHMTLSLTLACLWVVVAAGLSWLPSKRNHWPLAYVLIAIGLPLLAYVYVDSGPGAFVLCLAVGAMVLRWPLIHLWRRLRGVRHD